MSNDRLQSAEKNVMVSETDGGPRRRKTDWNYWTPIICFLVSVLMVCLPAALLIPAGGGMDEPSHIARIDQLAHGGIFPQRVGRGVAGYKPSDGTKASTGDLYGGKIDSALIGQAQMGQYGMRQSRSYHFPTWTDSRANSHQHYGIHSGTVSFQNSAINTPIVYAPQLLAFLVARLMTKSVYWLIIAMRLGGVLFFCLIGLLVLRLVPWGRWIFAAVLMMPGLLLIASTVTADLVTFCCVILLAALTVRVCVTGRLRRLDLACYIGSALVLSSVKMIYITCLAFVLVPLLLRRLRTRRNICILGASVIASASLFLAWYARIHTINTSLNTAMQTDPQAQTQFLLSHPFRAVFAVLTQSLFHNNMFATTETGALSLHKPTATMLVTPATVVMVMLLAACIYEAGRLPRAIHLRRSVSVIMIAVVAVSCCLLAIAEYLQWTVVGSRTITGVMDRYFLPFIPLLIVPLCWFFGLRTLDSSHGEVIDDSDTMTEKASSGTVRQCAGLAVCTLFMDLASLFLIASLFVSV